MKALNEDEHEHEDTWIHLAIAVANVKRWLELTKEKQEPACHDRNCGHADEENAEGQCKKIDRRLDEARPTRKKRTAL